MFEIVRSNERLRVLWLATVASKVGAGLRQIALPWLVLVLTGSPLQLGIVVALQAAPAAVFAPLLGHVVDRRPRKRLLVAGAVGTGSAPLALALVGAAGTLSIVHVYAMMLVLSVSETLSYLSRRATMPTFVDDERLDEANALVYGTGAAVSLGAILTGGVLTDLFGAVSVLGASSLATLVGAAILLRLSLPAREYRPLAAGSVVEDLRAGARTIRRTPVVLTVLLTGMAINLFVVPLSSVVLPVIGEDIFGRALAFTLLLAGFRAGTVAGNWLVGELSWSSTRKYTTGIGATGVTFVCTGLAGHALTGSVAVPETLALGALTSLLVAVGLVQPFYNVSGTSIVQSAVADEQRGTVLSVNNAAMEASFPLPLLAAGYVLGQVSPFGVLALAGLGALGVWAVTAWLLSAPRVPVATSDAGTG